MTVTVFLQYFWLAGGLLLGFYEFPYAVHSLWLNNLFHRQHSGWRLLQDCSWCVRKCGSCFLRYGCGNFDFGFDDDDGWLVRALWEEGNGIGEDGLDYRRDGLGLKGENGFGRLMDDGLDDWIARFIKVWIVGGCPSSKFFYVSFSVFTFLLEWLSLVLKIGLLNEIFRTEEVVLKVLTIDPSSKLVEKVHKWLSFWLDLNRSYTLLLSWKVGQSFHAKVRVLLNLDVKRLVFGQRVLEYRAELFEVDRSCYEWQVVWYGIAFWMGLNEF